MTPKGKKLLIFGVIAAAAYLIYKYVFKGAGIAMTSAGGASAVSVTNPVTIKRNPPPGYSGPVNGPFKWAGIGNPPNGVYETLGTPVN